MNMTISSRKLKIGATVKFAGHIISASCIRPDPDFLASIRDFPKPTDRKHIRSFLGLAVQLGNFLPDLAHNTTLLRQLTSEKNAFLWLDSHESQFQKLKRLLTSDMLVRPFDPALPSLLVTDASRLYGLGYALLQKEPNGSQRSNKGIKHETSSPYNPQSNGLAESAVKNIKHLLLKCSMTGQDFGEALHAWRNVPRACLLYTSPSPRDLSTSRMPSSA